MVIYSKKLRNILLDRGFKEVKEPERNIQHPELLVFFFEDTEEIRDVIEQYRKKS